MNRQERRRTKYDPDHHYWQGRERLDQSDWPGAAAAFKQAIKLAPDHAPFHRALGLAVARLDRFGEAISAFRKAAELDPTLARAWSDLGVTMLKAGIGAEAIPFLERALAIEPELQQARTTLAVALANEGQADRALTILERAVEDVADPEVQYARGTAKLRQAKVDEALIALRRAIELEPNHVLAYHNLLFTLQHSVTATAATLYEEHRRWGTIQETLRPRRALPQPQPHRAERLPVIGLVSGDLRRHAVGLLTIRAIEGLSRLGYKIVCFANQAESDDISERFKRASHRWHHVHLLSDDELYDLVRKDHIDILFDLSGHTGRHRLGLFALRSAALQGSWAGYVGTTGLADMDFLIADPIEVPAGEDPFYAEEIVRLPDCYVTYEPPVDAPPVAPLPCLDTGFVTFGCFNRPAKLNLSVFNAWRQILDRVPKSRILLKYNGVDTGQTNEVMIGLMQQVGIAPDRIEFESGRTSVDMQAGYHRVDIGLDPFPYSGGVTTLEATWMGVPVVALRGRSFAGRHSASHLHAMGLDSLVADDVEGYVSIAAALAQDVPRLTALRAGLRDRFLHSPLYDGDRFAQNLGTELRALWRRRCGAAMA
jgi:predicted O-linked N-acetylglucosamine transferase (SPINDLY family)